VDADARPLTGMDDDDARRLGAMECDLKDDWERALVCLGQLDPRSLDVASRSFWLGVQTGVYVTAKRMNGAY